MSRPPGCDNTRRRAGAVRPAHASRQVALRSWHSTGPRLGLYRGENELKETGMYDLLIKNGTVIDGTGAARRQADVAIKDGKVAEIGRITEAAAKTIDA